MPEWVPLATEQHEGQPEIAGSIADSALAELLAYAFNQSFSGRLVLRLSSDRSLGIRFEHGRVDRADAGEHEPLCERAALESYLPPEVLAFAQEHARAHGVTLFQAVETLVLLPPESLSRARAEYLKRQVMSLCALPPDTRYAFFREAHPGTGERSPVAAGLEPLGLIVSVILAEPALERARRSVQAFRHERLVLTSKSPSEFDLSGPARSWIKQLRHTPCSFEELDRLQPAASDELVALIYALSITGLVTFPTGSSEPPRPMHYSRVPRSISSQAVRAVSKPNLAGDTSYSVTGGPRFSQRPRVSSDAPPVTPRTRAQQECAAEAKVVQAWMLGEADRSFLHKSRIFVGKVVQLFPDNPRIRYCYACLQRRAQQFDSAIEQFARVVELDANHADAKRELDQLLQWRKSKRRAGRD
jgi:hypothetical protein